MRVGLHLRPSAYGSKARSVGVSIECLCMYGCKKGVGEMLVVVTMVLCWYALWAALEQW
jgi:hypothetical protein